MHTLVTIILLVLAIWMVALWMQSKKNPGRGTGALWLPVGLAIVVFILSWFIPSPKPNTLRAAATWDTAMAEVLGGHVYKLVPEGGTVLVFIIAEKATINLATLAAQREDYLNGLRRGLGKQFNIIQIESATSQGTFDSESLQAAIRSHPDAKAVVNFLWSPQGLKGIAVPLPTTWPKIVAGGMSEAAAKTALEKGWIHAAVVNRPGVTIDVNQLPEGNAQQIFDSRYLLMIPEAPRQ